MAIKILIIEDTDDIRDALVISLTESGFRVAAAARGEEAFAELTTFIPDIVLLDMHLPGMSGIDILKELRKTLTVPILMFTSSGAEETIKDAIAFGATDYVLKETGMGELIDRVKKQVDASTDTVVTAVPSVPEEPGTPPMIMYVGEDAVVTRMIATMSRRLAIESTRVSTAKVAISRISKSPPAIVVADLELRDSDGLSLMKALKADAETSGIPVIILAESAPPEKRRSALSHGTTAFYMKPVDPNELEQLVRKLLNSKFRVGAA